MAKNYFPQEIKDEAVLFYERGHTFAETRAKYGILKLGTSTTTSA